MLLSTSAWADNNDFQIYGGTTSFDSQQNYTGITDIGADGAIKIIGDGDISQSSGVRNNGSLDISGANSTNVKIKTIDGSGKVITGNNNLFLTHANAETGNNFFGTITGKSGIVVDGSNDVTLPEDTNNPDIASCHEILIV